MAINWKGIDLACRAADLVAEDRRAHGRPPGDAGTLRKRYGDCLSAFMVRTILTLNALTNAGY